MLALILGATVVGTLGTILSSGLTEKKQVDTQKTTININGSFNKTTHINNNNHTNSNYHNSTTNNKANDEERVINEIRKMFKEQQDNQKITDFINSIDEELKRY